MLSCNDEGDSHIRTARHRMFDRTDPIMTADTMTIRQMCDAFEVTPRTLRFYEQKELLFPIRDGQKRLFTRRDRARLKLILRGKRFGFSLEEIRQLLDLYYVGDQQATQLSRTIDIARDRLTDMERQRAELDVAIHDLRSQMSLVQDMLASRGSAQDAAE
jgi:DNA-binding transcriptional MerR regulator